MKVAPRIVSTATQLAIVRHASTATLDLKRMVRLSVSRNVPMISTQIIREGDALFVILTVMIAKLIAMLNVKQTKWPSVKIILLNALMNVPEATSKDMDGATNALTTVINAQIRIAVLDA